MIDPKDYLEILVSNDINFFSGVPDSLLKEFCACVTDTFSEDNHIIAANEGAAVGLGIGHHLGTGKMPLIYLQNSGLGNTINPILSLASPEVYGIPMLIMIGWRGEPGLKDEPQHVHQGRVMISMLDTMNIDAIVLSDELEEAKIQTEKAILSARKTNSPVALLVSKGLFSGYDYISPQSNLNISREDAIIAAASVVENDAIIISTTGMASRELFEYRASKNEGHHRDFLTVGGMGHASQIALGIALAQKRRPVYSFDGDGAAIMHMGSMAISGQAKCDNFIHVIFNNGAHASVGGQPTVGLDISFPMIAEACGYSTVLSVDTRHELLNAITDAQIAANTGESFIDVKTGAKNRKDIGRPTATPSQNKTDLMKFLAKE